MRVAASSAHAFLTTAHNGIDTCRIDIRTNGEVRGSPQEHA